MASSVITTTRGDMEAESLAAAFEREHREIDEGIAALAASPGDPQPLTRAIRALRRHIYLEEEFLFPLLRRAEPALAAPVFVMLREHAEIWATLDELEREPGGASRALYRQLASRLLHHNLKEERVLYPRADEVLSPAAAGQLQAFLGSGELPEGWVCIKARSVTPDAGRRP
jgi:iron-sulfur cluster repair protein YtfE (RIC family)